MRPFQPKQGPSKGLTPTKAFPVAAAGAAAGPAAWLDNVRFTPSNTGMGDWVYFAFVPGYQSPSAAGALDGTVYRQFAISSDFTQWEIASGAYIRATGTFLRTNVLYNSSGTGTGVGQTGDGTRINFLTNPQVAIVAIKEDMLSAAEANNFTPTQKTQARANISVSLRGCISGLTLSTAGSSSSFGIAVGEATDSTGVDLLALTSVYTKTTSAWTLGTAGGALDTSTIAINTWYNVYLIKRVDTGTVDVLISLSSTTAPTLPAGYTLFRRIGAIKTDSSSQWLKFVQAGDEFLWAANVIELPYAAIASATAQTLSMTGVPPNVVTRALMHLAMGGGGATASVLVTAIDENDIAPISIGNGANATLSSPSGFVTADIEKRVGTATTLRYRMSVTTGSFGVFTFGYIDTRGRLD